MPMVAQMAQQANGPHSTPSTPQSQTPNTPGLHGGPPTPGPLVAVNQPPAPQTPQPAPVMFPGSNLPAHSVAGPFNPGQPPTMVLMQGHGPHPAAAAAAVAAGANPNSNTGHPGHGHNLPVVPVMSATAPTALVTQMPAHFQPQPQHQQQPNRPPQQQQQQQQQTSGGGT